MNFNLEVKVGNRLISRKSQVFIIAEAGVNHSGDMQIAKRLIDLAVNAGADAVKFQTFRAENLILKAIEKAPYQKKSTKDNSQSQYEMLKTLEVSEAQNVELQKYCSSKGIVFLTTPFEEESLDSLDQLDLPAYKVASTDLTNLPFLEKIAKKGKPIFLSTGMSYLSEIETALETIYSFNKDVVLLHCTANYPISDDEVNLNVINSFKKSFSILLGFSDHTEGVGASPFAVPMGAKVIEKHFTIDKKMIGPDHKASLSPQELMEFVQTIRRVEKYMGGHVKMPTLSEIGTRKSLQKCLVASKLIKKGEVFSLDNIVAKRTGGVGISPIYFANIIGKFAKKTFNENEIIDL